MTEIFALDGCVSRLYEVVVYVPVADVLAADDVMPPEEFVAEHIEWLNERGAAYQLDLAVDYFISPDRRPHYRYCFLFEDEAEAALFKLFHA